MGPLLVLLFAHVYSTKIFKWDIDDLEQVFCRNSMSEEEKQGSQFQTKEEGSQFLVSKSEKARSKLAIWPWEYNDSFEGECIEEGCSKAEVQGFTSECRLI